MRDTNVSAVEVTKQTILIPFDYPHTVFLMPELGGVSDPFRPVTQAFDHCA
jgi:hypothetical protein